MLERPLVENGTATAASRPARPDVPAAVTRTYRVVALSRFLLRITFRPRARGREHVPDGGCVLAANQLSNLDGVALSCVLHPRPVRWLGKAELFGHGLAPVMRRLGIVPVQRGKGDVRALATMISLARAGDAVGIFPEGTRRAKGFRKTRTAVPMVGAARVALAAGVPLVPVAIAGTERVTLLRRWRLVVGRPVPEEGLSSNRRLAARELTERLMARIATLEADLADERPHRLHPRHRLDLGAGDLACALGATVTASGRGLEGRVLDRWAGGKRSVVCLSVRTGFDLLLESLGLQPGDEIAASAITHPDMARIAEAHGLRVLPIDIDPDTLAPRVEALARAIGPRTRLVVVAHLFGSRVELAPIRALADRFGLLLVEDCAQSFHGPDHHGDPLADVSLFSFGTIKTATALGGALVEIRDETLRERVRTLNEELPRQPRSVYARKAARVAGLKLLARPRVYALFAKALTATGKDLDAVVNGSVRGFASNADLLSAIRRRPSPPLLALLERRLRRFDSVRLRARAIAGDHLAAGLTQVEQPGGWTVEHTHWLFPVCVDAPGDLVGRLRPLGFDASRATSAITALPAPADRPDLEPHDAIELMDRVVFLPAYPELGDDLDRLARVLER